MTTTVGNVAHPDADTSRYNTKGSRCRNDKHTDKSDVDVSEKVRLYNLAFLRYNDTAKDRAAKPTPVVVVKENEPIVPTDVMADVVTTLPKMLQEKGSQLVSRLKTTK